MKKKASSKSLPVPISAMIDVVFLLLVFFIVTSQDILEEAYVSVNLPGEGREGKPSEKIPLDIYVRSGNYQILGKSMSLSELAQSLDKYKDLSSDMTVNLKVSPKASHEDLVLVLDQLSKVDFEDYNINTLK
jgi:biopolymer transport protein ExbD